MLGRFFSGPFWVVLCLLMGVALTYVTHLPDTAVKKETPPKSYLDKVVAFCLEPKHESSKLCIVRNPKTNEEVEKAVKDSIKREINNRTFTSGSKPIVVHSEGETRNVEERTSTRIVQEKTTTPERTPAPQPTNEEPRIVEVPDVTSVKLPKVEVPKVKTPDISNIKDKLGTDTLIASK